MIRHPSLAVTLAAVTLAAVSLAGCTSTSLRSALSTPKNPTPIFTDPVIGKGKQASQDAIIRPLYKVLLEAHDAGDVLAKTASEQDIRRYLAAGFALSDIYCAQFFIKTDEAYRRRRFGRTLTNDVGTAVATILGLAKAGEGIVTGVAAGVGFADSGWRNYDDSFIISPDLSNVQSLVVAAQDNLRARTLARNAELPEDYASAQTAILRYANLCSFLGMKALLDQSAGEQRRELNTVTDKVNLGGLKKTAEGAGDDTTAPASPAAAVLPSTASPSIAANKAGDEATPQ
ncbi:MAG TPA: hypothetical protein VM900_01215 [Sphingomonas sp.]|nr:hypothetical protein [Sphingomonas sp.]